MRKLGFALLLVLLMATISVLAFFGAGTIYLSDCGYLVMSGEQREQMIRDLEDKVRRMTVISSQTGISLDQFHSNGREVWMVQSENELGPHLAKCILLIALEDGWEQAEAFCEEFHLQYRIYHSQGRPLGGNLEVGMEKETPKYQVTYANPETGESGAYAIYLRYDPKEFQYVMKIQYQFQLYWMKNSELTIWLAVIFLFLSLLLFGLAVWMMRKGRGERKGLFGCIPLGILPILGGIGLFFLGRAFWQNLQNNQTPILQILLFWFALVLLFLWITFFLWWRVEEPKWYRKTLTHLLMQEIGRVVAGWKEVLRNLSATWRFFLILTGIFLVEIGLVLALLPWNESTAYLLTALLIFMLLLMPWLLRHGIALETLKKTMGDLAAGKMDARIETERLPRTLKGLGENVNAMAGSVSMAVEERLKSERLKTELITNVSHDIKTPLTSIINFSDLIEKEETENPKVKEYASHLHAQSSRLKKLIEDLIEASKASTGNLEVHMEPCDAKVLLDQCLGEYEDRLKENGLELMLKQSETPLRIMADPRLLWRVFDNLMNNVCKYAQKDTRVYLSAEQTRETVRLLFRNVSKYALDVSPEDLLERFVRGDLSRHTEGYGLGLSIVRSLMELQGGTIALAVDADLFKVTLEFPLAPEPGKEGLTGKETKGN